MGILTLPKELQLHIINLLSVRERLRLSKTCHGLNDLVMSLWKNLVLNYEEIKNNTMACRGYVARCSSLRELCIIESGGRVNSDKIMGVVMKAKTTLTTLSLGDFALSNASFKKISQITQLTKLEINGENIKSDGIASLANLSELRSLKIVKKVDNVDNVNTGIASKDLINFLRMKKLEKVDIRDLDELNDSVIESLVVNNPNLRHLDLSTCFITKLTDRGLQLIADNCPQLITIKEVTTSMKGWDSTMMTIRSRIVASHLP